jgi:hypothetical protein
MRTTTKLLATSAIALSLLVGSAAPAFAASFTDGDIQIGDSTNGTKWYLTDQGSIDHSYVYVDGFEYDRVYCGTEGGLEINGDYLNSNGDFDLTTDINGDKVVTGTGSFGDLTVAAEYRMYAEGDFLRTVYVITNPTSDPITFTPSVFEDPQDNSSDAATTTNGDNVVDTTDNYYTTFNTVGEDDGPSVVFSRFWGSPSAFGIQTTNGLGIASADYSTDVVFNDVTIAAGASYQWVTFTRLGSYVVTGNQATDDVAALASSAIGVSEFSAAWVPSERLLRNIDTTIASNWAFIAPAEEVVVEPVLASTGVDTVAISTTGFLGAAVLAAGFGLVVLRRRKA